MTHAENFYWIKQMQSRTPMAIVLQDGEPCMESWNGTTATALS